MENTTLKKTRGDIRLTAQESKIERVTNAHKVTMERCVDEYYRARHLNGLIYTFFT